MVQGANILVNAGPGTGKTRVLTARIAWLLEQGTDTHDLLAITFTNKAASEMAERMKVACPEEGVKITTFHSWAYDLLRKKHPLDRTPVVITEDEQKRLFREAAHSIGLKGDTRPLFQRLQFLKQFFPIDLQDEAEDLRLAWQHYQNSLAAHNLYDFDDLIISAIAILEEERGRDPNFRPYRHILIDEFQDVSPAQYRLCQLLAGPGCCIMAIGDPHQSIYGFRGSNPALMEKFMQDFSPCTRISLITAYRCGQNLLDAARVVLREKSAPRLISANTIPGSITFKQFKGPSQEATWIAKTIDRLSGGVSFESLNQGSATGQELRSLSDIAILFRINSLGEILAKELAKMGIPYQVSPKSHHSSDENLNKIWHILELLEGHHADYHSIMLSQEERKIVLSLSGHKKQALRTLEPVNLLDALSEAFGLHLESVEKTFLERAIASHRQGKPLSLALKTEQDYLDFHVEAVSLLSLHASKGLEFPIVFIAGCEQDIIPLKDCDPREERRLFYVGLTRASEQIFITCTSERQLWGERITVRPSQFIKEIDGFIEKEGKKPGVKRRKKVRQKKLF